MSIIILTCLFIMDPGSDPCSVADQGCLFRIPDHDFYPSRIPDQKTETKERGEKKFDVIPDPYL
jgi:hypothetical protein